MVWLPLGSCPRTGRRASRARNDCSHKASPDLRLNGHVETRELYVLMNRREFVALGLASMVIGPKSSAEESTLEKDARIAWLFALPLIEMAGARARKFQITNGSPNGSNIIAHAQGLAGPENRVVTTPNADTIYSNAFIDLTNGPVTLVMPDAGHRYISVAILDMFTNINFVLGTSTPGGGVGTYRLIGPNETARDERDLRVLTPHGWLLARILVDGEAGLAAAKRIQQGILLKGPEAPSPPP